MGRYYSGDIEGKFWFAVQDSSDADFFGVEGVQPNELNYYYSESDIETIKSGIKTCKKELGDYKEKLDKFFEKNNGYNDEMLMKEFKISAEKVKTLLVWYARLELGNKILKCVKDNGDCSFTAEM